MTGKQKAEPKLTDAERHERFVEMAREVKAAEDPKAFDRAFERVTGRPEHKPKARDDG